MTAAAAAAVSYVFMVSTLFASVSAAATRRKSWQMGGKCTTFYWIVVYYNYYYYTLQLFSSAPGPKITTLAASRRRQGGIKAWKMVMSREMKDDQEQHGRPTRGGIMCCFSYDFSSAKLGIIEYIDQNRKVRIGQQWARFHQRCFSELQGLI